MAAKKPAKPEAGTGLDAAMAQIHKQYGDGAIMRLGEGVIGPVTVIDSGSIALNQALGTGGLPKGRVIEIYGPEGSGKTTLSLEAGALCQKAGGTVAFIDAEHALDPDFAAGIGVDTDALLISQPGSGEEALEIADLLLHSGGVDLIIIDSVAALVPQAEIDGEMGESRPGAQARLMSQALRKLTAALTPGGPAIIFINQLREKIGVFFGSPETTSGGKALKFYSSVRLDVRRIETLKRGTEAIGGRLRIKVVKNKLAPPFKIAEVDLIWGRGFSHEGELIDFGVATGVLRKSGAYYIWDDGESGAQLGQGREKVREFLEANQAVAARLDFAVAEALRERKVSLTPAPREPAPVEPAGKRVAVGTQDSIEEVL